MNFPSKLQPIAGPTGNSVAWAVWVTQIVLLAHFRHAMELELQEFHQKHVCWSLFSTTLLI